MNDHDRGRGAAPDQSEGAGTDDSRSAGSRRGLLDGRYRVISRLGSGGMADVYLAEDETLGRRVAVKVLKKSLAADAEFVERFRIEARAAASLNHPNIVAVYDRGSVAGTAYIAMEYVCGESLKERLRRDGALAPNDALAIALAVLAALGAAHEREIVHRDVTAYNVLLEANGRVKVADFGIARVGASALTRTGVMLGTSSYLSPEQAQGRTADERSDVYSLGVVLFEMLTGRVPFRGETDVVVAMQHVSAAPPNPRSLSPAVSEALAAAVMQALSKDPADRYQTAAEFAEALRRVRAGAVVAPPSPAPHLQAPASAGDAPAGPGEGPAAEPSRAATALAASAEAAGGSTRLASEAPTRYRVPAGTAEAGRPRRRRMRRLLLTALAAGALAALAAVVYVIVLAAGPTVPVVVGVDRAEAAAAVRDEGLRPAVHFVWSDKHATGAVVRQKPRGGTAVEDGVKVDLWVSRGPLHIPAPDLGGLAASVARERLEAASLNGRSRRAASESAPKGEIFKQKPAAGATVERGDTVTFWVSSGPPEVAVPDVVGLSQGEASALLEEEGFIVQTDLVLGWGVFPGDVVAQDPAAGARARPGDEVLIEVAVF